MDLELDKNEEFDQWCFTAMDDRMTMEDGKPLPVLTVVLHRCCEDDPRRLSEATRALQLAFEAGQSTVTRTGYRAVPNSVGLKIVEMCKAATAGGRTYTQNNPRPFSVLTDGRIAIDYFTLRDIADSFQKIS